MIPGLNTNVEYQDLIWHIQTEDYGPDANYFVTQIFRQGEVIATSKSEYASDCSLGEKLRRQRTTHHAMVEALRSGEFVSDD